MECLAIALTIRPHDNSVGKVAGQTPTLPSCLAKYPANADFDIQSATF